MDFIVHVLIARAPNQCGGIFVRDIALLVIRPVAALVMLGFPNRRDFIVVHDLVEVVDVVIDILARQTVAVAGDGGDDEAGDFDMAVVDVFVEPQIAIKGVIGEAEDFYVRVLGQIVDEIFQTV